MEQQQRKTVHRVRHELRMREVTVLRITPVGEHFASITFGGESLADFVSLSFDDHVKFMFDDGAGNQVRRDYTPRRFNAQSRELTIEFALHGDGAASNWARNAQPGDRAIIGGPRGSMIVPLDFDWHLLAGDSTALPAMRRRLEELPSNVHVTVIALADAGDRLPFTGAAQAAVHWVDSEEALFERVRAFAVPAGEGFAWGAGEAATMRRLRTVLAEEKGIAKEAMRVSAYWKQGVADHHENLE